VTALTGLDLGVSYNEGRVKAEDETAADPQAKGLTARGPGGFRFSTRHFVDGRRRRLGADGAFHAVRRAQGRDRRGWEERNGQGATFDDLPRVVTTGWAVSGTWLVTGDRKRNTIRPRHPLPHGLVR